MAEQSELTLAELAQQLLDAERAAPGFRLRPELKVELRRLVEESDLRLPIAWQNVTGIKVLDHDGWRVDGKSFDEPINRAEFQERAELSTISIHVHSSDAYHGGI